MKVMKFCGATEGQRKAWLGCERRGAHLSRLGYPFSCFRTTFLGAVFYCSGYTNLYSMSCRLAVHLVSRAGDSE